MKFSENKSLMAEFKPLSSEEVFLIADPIITLDTLEEIGVPSTKVDLKARLSIELNRQILSSSGQNKKMLRKDLKRLLNDKTSAKEDKRRLEELLYKKDKKNYALQAVSRDELLLDKNREINQTTAEIARLKTKFDAEVQLKKDYDKLKTIALRKKFLIDNKLKAPPTNKYTTPFETNKKKFTDVRDKLMGDIDKLKEERQKLLSKQSNTEDIRFKFLPETEKELSKLDASILDLDERIKKEEEYEKTHFDEINPAVFEKSLAERVAESNNLFQGVLNAGQQPHITLAFEDIGDYSELNELFVEKSTGKITNMILIIYRSEENFGHWCCLTRSNDLRSVTYFNSYGAYIDKAIDHIPERFRDISRQNFPYLLKLLHRSNYEVHWNDVQLQEMDGKTATCGHWCGLWMRNNALGKTLEQFTLPFESIPLQERDGIVVKITRPYLMG